MIHVRDDFARMCEEDVLRLICLYCMYDVMRICRMWMR